MVIIPEFFHSYAGFLRGVAGTMFVLCSMIDDPRAFEAQGCTVGKCHPVFDSGTCKQFTDVHQTFQTLFVPDGIDYDFYVC